MANPALQRLLHDQSQPEAVEKSIAYLSEHLKPILRDGERVMVCFPRTHSASLGAMLEQAVKRCGETPIFWEGDLRWITLLRMAFNSRASTIIAPPLVILGLSKLAANSGIPLNIHNAVMAGYPALTWMIEGIERGLDCRSWGIFGPGTNALVSGFSCGCGTGIHMREDTFQSQILDTSLRPVSDGRRGMLAIQRGGKPETLTPFYAYGNIQREPCPCGDSSPKVVNIALTEGEDKSAPFRIAEELLYWSSVLEVSVKQTECGLELIAIVFPGKQLPKFPSVARRVVRSWDPETDIPISISENWGETEFYLESH